MLSISNDNFVLQSVKYDGQLAFFLLHSGSLLITYIFSSPCTRAFFFSYYMFIFHLAGKRAQGAWGEGAWKAVEGGEGQGGAKVKDTILFVYLIRMMFDWSRYIRFIFISSSFNLRHGAGVTERIRGSKRGRKWCKGSLSFMTELSQQNNSLRNPYRTTKINH